MLSDRLSRRRAIAYIVLLALSLVMLMVGNSTPVQELRRGVTFAVAPIQDALADATRSVTSVLGAFGEIDTLRRQNQELRASVGQLRDEVAVLEAVRDENQRLARLLKTVDRLDHETVVASVSARHSTAFERVISVDRGSEAGIIDGAPVLSEGGALAGQVIDVGEGWASVMLITDTRSLITGLDSRTRATGAVVGRLSAPLAMADIPVTDTVTVNDRIVTAGLDLGRRFRSQFPKGIPIGNVVDVQRESGSIVQTALVQPTSDLDRLEYVLVITDYAAPRVRDDELVDEAP